MELIIDSGSRTYTQLEEALPETNVDSILVKLEERRLIGTKDDLYFSLYDIRYPKSLSSENAGGLKLKEGRAEYIIKPRLSELKLKGLIRGLYPGCEVTGAGLVYSPILEVLYAGESSKRRVRINARTGKILHGT